MDWIFHGVLATETRGLNFYASGVGAANLLTALTCHLWFWYSEHRRLTAA